MLFKFKSLTTLTPHKNPNPHFFNHQTLRTFIDSIEINYVRDRGLDHAVEKEKDLKPLLTLKNLLKLQPSNSLPLSSILEANLQVRIPYRPIEFIRKYPSFFEEYYPGHVRIHPHVRLTPESLNLDSEEMMVYQSDLYRKKTADRLCKLLMLCCVNEIPLSLIDRLKWDLGLPDDYLTSLVPDFPDYFRLKRGVSLSSGSRVDGILELVCWSNELGMSVLESKARRGGMGYQKGMPIAFPLSFSKGFEMDKRLKKWVDEWQKLPYVSPYENATHLQPNSDESDKWVVGVLHEFLNILVSKKIERDDALFFGEYLGIRSRMKRALIHHPGIFYMSSKIGTYTVVLRDGYKRDLLIEKNPLAEIRNKYIHLMHNAKQVEKVKTLSDTSAGKKQMVKADAELSHEGDNDDEKEKGVGDENESEEEEEDKIRRGRHGRGRRGHEKEARMGVKNENENEDNKSRKGRCGSGWKRHEKGAEMGNKNESEDEEGEDNKSRRGRRGSGRRGHSNVDRRKGRRPSMKT